MLSAHAYNLAEYMYIGKGHQQAYVNYMYYSTTALISVDALQDADDADAADAAHGVP